MPSHRRGFGTGSGNPGASTRSFAGIIAEAIDRIGPFQEGGDTSVIADILTKDPDWFEWSSGQLESWADQGPICFEAIIFAELPVKFALVPEEPLAAKRRKRPSAAEPQPKEHDLQVASRPGGGIRFRVSEAFRIFLAEAAERRVPSKTLANLIDSDVLQYKNSKGVFLG